MVSRSQAEKDAAVRRRRLTLRLIGSGADGYTQQDHHRKGRGQPHRTVTATSHSHPPPHTHTHTHSTTPLPPPPSTIKHQAPDTPQITPAARGRVRQCSPRVLAGRNSKFGGLIGPRDDGEFVHRRSSRCPSLPQLLPMSAGYNLTSPKPQKKSGNRWPGGPMASLTAISNQPENLAGASQGLHTLHPFQVCHLAR